MGGKGREWKGREGKGKEGKGRGGEGRGGVGTNLSSPNPGSAAGPPYRVGVDRSASHKNCLTS